MKRKIKPGTSAALMNLREIAESAMDSKMEEAHLLKIDKNLIRFSKYLKTSKMQAYLVAVIFSLNFSRKDIDIDDIARYLKCNPIKLLELKTDFDYLINNGFLKTKYVMDSSELPLANFSFTVTKELSEAIINNSPVIKNFAKQKLDQFTLLEKIYDLGRERHSEDIPTFILSESVKNIVKSNLNIPFFKMLNKMKLIPEEMFVICYLGWKLIEGDKSETILIIANMFHENIHRRMGFIRNMAKKNSKLFTMNIVEAVGKDFANNIELSLTEKTIEQLLGNDYNLFIQNEKIKNCTRTSEIKKKILFYNENEEGSITRLYQTLSPNNFNNLQKRLENKNLPIGIAVLLEGGPGTGKTETAFQLAKECGRDIMHVDISQSKSMWFGESEKVIKRIFSDYEQLCLKTKKTPILLFNEADAIISRRVEGKSSGVSQTENAIQNIILEEMERFKGILIATTNLANNFDPAFERRFLFKIHFKQPDVLTKTKIWKDKIPVLKLNDCKRLAEEFNFSGGQIENVVRKIVMSEVVNNTRPCIDEIIAFCREELPSLKRPRLGFVV